MYVKVRSVNRGGLFLKGCRMDFELFEKMARHADSEDGVCARFYDRAVKTGKIDSSGFPVFEDVCFCEIRIKDNTTEVFDQPADENKIKRFPAEYARYRLGKKQRAKGTPLEQVAFLTQAETEALKYRGIFTVEALAGLADDKAESLNVSREKDLARRFCQAAKEQMSLAQYSQKLEAAEAEITRLKQRLAGAPVVKGGKRP